MIFIVDYLQKENIDSFLQLDKQVYDQIYWVDKETTMKRIVKNPYTDITVCEGNQMIGYISLCPIPSSVFSLILQNAITEEEIESHTIPYTKTGRYVAYLSSIVVDKQHFPSFRGKFLFYYLQEHIKRLNQRGIWIDSIVAHAVSGAGRRTLLRFGFQEKESNIFIYRCERREIKFFSPFVYTPIAHVFVIDVVVPNCWRDA